MKKKKFLSRELDAKSKETLNELLAIRNWTFHNSQSTRIYVWGQTPLKFYKVGKQKEKLCIC